MIHQQAMSLERYQRIRAMLANRQPDLTLLLEEVRNPHNVSAVIRSADAVGVHCMHAVWNQADKLQKCTAMGSQNWVAMQYHNTAEQAIDYLKSQHMQVLVTNIDDNAVDFRQVDYTQPTAIVFGQEKFGVTAHAIAKADQSIMIPMIGMVQSLNISVAAATILYEAQRQRENAGMYNKNLLSETESQRILFERGFPALHKACVTRNLSFPIINGQGQIEADNGWWQAIQFSTRNIPIPLTQQ